MTDAASASLLISPDLRRRLQQRYAEAQQLAAQHKPDYRRIHVLLAECLQADPGGVLYLDALISNLRRRDAHGTRSWFSFWMRPCGKGETSDSGEIVPPAQLALLRRAPDLLWQQPADPSLFHKLAEAAETCELDQVALRYRQLALEAAPDDADSLRQLARAYSRRGQFAEAAENWNQLAQAIPNNTEAQQALADIGETHQFDKEAATLASAQAAGAPLLETLRQREELHLARSEHRLEIARRRAASDSHPRAHSLVQQLEAEHARLEIEVFHLRCERHPDDWKLRLELATRLKRIGNFSGAIQRLEEAEKLCPDEPTLLIELGECWQHLRQFTSALDLYRRAIRAAEKSIERQEALNLARYRAGLLAAALGEREEARTHFNAILALAPTFKDTQQRLDNLGAN